MIGLKRRKWEFGLKNGNENGRGAKMERK